MFTLYYLTENIDDVVYVGCVLFTFTHMPTFFFGIFPLCMFISYKDTHNDHSTESTRVCHHCIFVVFILSVMNLFPV
jgi:hypothetical protein